MSQASKQQTRTLCRRCIEKSGKGGGSGGSDTSPTGMHASPEKITGGSPQEGMRRLLPVRRGLEFRVHTTRQESLDAPAVARRLLPMDAGNVPSVRSKGTREAYRSHPTPRSSTPGRHHSGRPPSSTPRSISPCSRTGTPKDCTGHGAPGAGACRRLQQTRPADRAGDALRGLGREVGVEGVILRPTGCTPPLETERVDRHRRGCEG
jgi:hypothetical protein